MKNLKLAHKMLVLTVILMTSILVVAIVAVNRLERVNSQNRNLVDRTILKSKLTSQLQVHILDTIRAQKNSILSPDDERSKEFAALSRASLSQAHTVFDRLSGLILQDHVEAQAVAVGALNDALVAYEKVNEEVLNLSVQNTNVKARKQLAGDVRRQANILAAYFQKWFAAVASKNPPNAAELARLDAVYKLHTALLELIPSAAKHIEASDEDEMSALEKKMAEIQEQLQNGLAAASGGDPTTQVEPLAALGDLRTALAGLIKLSRTNSNNRSVAITLTGSKVTADDCGKRIDEIDELLTNEAKAGRDLSEATYQSGIWGILSVTIAGVILGGLLAALMTRSITRPVSELRNLAQAMALGDLRQRVPLHQRDEVGQLSDATNALANSLSQVVNEIQKVSDELAGSADGLSGVSNQLLSQSEQASLKATSVASAAEELSTNISTMAAAAEEMSVNV
ncbi:HAMP domain-containing methyl-accepting chemotaxis protein, partial [Singulisphaera rosea]